MILLFPQPITQLFMADAGPEALAMSIGALQLFAITYLTRWFSFATQSYLLAVEKSWQASVISVSTALIFPVVLVGVLWPGPHRHLAELCRYGGVGGDFSGGAAAQAPPELSRPDEKLPPKTR